MVTSKVNSCDEVALMIFEVDSCDEGDEVAMVTPEVNGCDEVVILILKFEFVDCVL